MNSARYFLGKLKTRVGEYEPSESFLVVANSEQQASTVLEDVAANYYGQQAPSEDGGYYFCGGDVHVSVLSLSEIGLGTFLELRRIFPTRYSDTCAKQEPEVSVPEGFKAFVKSAVNLLARRNVPVGHSQLLEVLAGALGVKNWQVLVDKLRKPDPADAPVAPVAVYPEPLTFLVDVTRTAYGSRTIAVQARSAPEAQELALEQVGYHEFNEYDAEYHADSARPVIN